MEILVIRHAEPVRVTAEESGGGPADPGLTPRGVDQSERLARWLVAEGVDHVVTSPLRRARETAAPLAAALGLETEIVDGLREYDAAADSYIPIEEMKTTDRARWNAMAAGRWEEFGGEPPETFRARIVPCMESVIAAHPGRRVAAICHGGVINLYLAVVLGIDRRLWFEPHYTSISRVRAARSGQRSVASINEAAHLVATRDLR